MEDRLVLVERDGHFATMTLNRPEKRNALNAGLIAELRAALRSIAEAPDVRALILAGAGKSFCAGLDLKETGATAGDGGIDHFEIEDALHELEACPVPTIAAIQGDAIAGGLELALHCDLRVAAASARVGMPLARIGLVVPFSLTQKLLDTVGTTMTKEMLFTGATLDAESARRAGLVSRVVPEGDLIPAARALAAEIAANAPLAVRTMKAAIIEANRFRSHTPSAGLAARAITIRQSDDLQEGLRAVFEKRRPTFRGR